MRKDKKFLKITLILSYIFIGLYIFIYSIKISTYQNLYALNFLTICCIINNVSFFIFLCDDRRDLILNYSTLVVLFLIWIIVDYVFLYRYKLSFGYYTEINLFFINILIFYNFYILLKKRIDIEKIKYFILFPIAMLFLSISLNYFGNSIYYILLKIWKAFISIYPISILIINEKFISRGSHKLLRVLFLIAIIYFIFFNVFMTIFPTLRNFYILEVILLTFAQATLFIFVFSFNRDIKVLSVKFYLNAANIIGVCLLTLLMMKFVENLIVSLNLSLIFLMSILNIKLYFDFTRDDMRGNYYKNYLYKNKLIESLSEVYEKNNARFLHDDILQDIILSKRLLSESHLNIDKSFILHDKLIKKIRTKISLIDPIFDEYISQYEIYLRLINSLQKMYSEEKHIEFYCDDDIFIPSPYEKLVYRFMHELAINFFKHSKGYFSEINLNIEGSVVNLYIENFGDYLDEGYTNTHSSGLKIIKKTLNIYNGKLIVKDNKENNKNVGSLVFRIELPILEEVVNENLINWRSQNDGESFEKFFRKK